MTTITTGNRGRAAPRSQIRPAPMAGTAATVTVLPVRRQRVGLAHPTTPYYLLIVSTLALLGIGLVMVTSSTSVAQMLAGQSAFEIGLNQSVFAAIGLVGAVLAAFLPLGFWQKLAWPLVGAAVMLLLITRVIGQEAGGTYRRINFGSFSFQPSEVAKLALILSAAFALSKNIHRFQRSGRLSYLLIPILPTAIALIGFVMLGKDLGTSLVLFVITLAMLFVAGTPGRTMGLLGLIAAGSVTMLAVFEPYRMERLLSFAGHCGANSDCTQQIRGAQSLGSGGLFGLGLGAGRQKWNWLPEGSTDYIFAVIGEELGLIGTLSVLMLFATIAYAGARVARMSRELYPMLVATGITTWIVSQGLINMAVVAGVIPVTGIPLPLISYGGTALVLDLVALGLLIGIARRTLPIAESLAGRRQVRRLRRQLAAGDRP